MSTQKKQPIRAIYHTSQNYPQSLALLSGLRLVLKLSIDRARAQCVYTVHSALPGVSH